MDELVEEFARFLHDQPGLTSPGSGRYPWDQIGDIAREKYRSRAKRILEFLDRAGPQGIG